MLGIDTFMTYIHVLVRRTKAYIKIDRYQFPLHIFGEDFTILGK